MPSVKVAPIDRLGGGYGTFAKYPAELGAAPWEKWILFEVRTGRHIARDGFVAESNGNVDRTLASVALYLPIDALKSSMAVSYKDFTMGAIAGTVIENMFQTGKNEVGTAAGGGIVEKFKTAQDAAKGAAKGAAQSYLLGLGQGILEIATLGQADSKNTVEALVGGAVNPRTDSVFENVEYRTHEFSFSLIPRTKDEALSIDTILNILHFYSLPNYGAGSAGQFFIGYPYEFVITMFTQVTGGGHHINTIERSVLTSLSVDHAGGDRVAFVDDRGGVEYFPAATKMTMSFKETRLLGRDVNPNTGRGVIFRGKNGAMPEYLKNNDPRAATDVNVPPAPQQTKTTTNVPPPPIRTGDPGSPGNTD